MPGRRTGDDWRTWVHVADQWFIAYASLPHVEAGVPFWCVGHAVELYLKAFVVKQTGTGTKAMRFSHDIRDLWRECRQLDSGFLPEYDLRDPVMDQDVLLLRAPSRLARLSPDDQQHFWDNEPLYIVAKHQGDLKYFLLPMKSRQDGPAVLVETWPNAFWIRFVKALRRQLGFPPPGTRDSIRQLLENQPQTAPPDTVAYLGQLYQ